jgi:hypothetical protein
VLTLRQSLDQARRVLPPDRFAELERVTMARPKAEAASAAEVLAITTQLAARHRGGSLWLCWPLPDFECEVCHHRLKPPTLAADVPEPDRVLLRRRDAFRLRFACNCRRGSWTRDFEQVVPAAVAARGQRRVPV